MKKIISIALFSLYFLLNTTVTPAGLNSDPETEFTEFLSKISSQNTQEINRIMQSEDVQYEVAYGMGITNQENHLVFDQYTKIASTLSEENLANLTLIFLHHWSMNTNIFHANKEFYDEFPYLYREYEPSLLITLQSLDETCSDKAKQTVVTEYNEQKEQSGHLLHMSIRRDSPKIAKRLTSCFPQLIEELNETHQTPKELMLSMKQNNMIFSSAMSNLFLDKQKSARK